MRSDRHRQVPQKKKNRTLRVLLGLIVLLLIAIIALLVYSYRTAKASLAITFTEEAPTVEFGGEYPALDYVLEASGDVSPAETFLNAETLGTHDFTYTVSKPLYGGLLRPSRAFELRYTVDDTVAPAVLWSGEGTVLERGTTFDINEVISYGDNADPSPSVEVDGEVDMETAGDYPLHITVADISGNETEWDLTIEVADSLPTPATSSERTDFEDFITEYEADGRTFGIDVSEWQGDVDFEAVRTAGCAFVLLRSGYTSDGEIRSDSSFARNLERARAAGLRIGLYFYSTDQTEEEARASAGWIAEQLGDWRPDLPIAFDWEDFGHFQEYGMSFADLERNYNAFTQALAEHGCDSILYSSKNRLDDAWAGTDAGPVWLAHYTDETDYEGPYRLWQASCTGRIDGIEGAVDLDILYE